MDDNTRALLVFALVGIVAGFLASIVVGGGGLLQYLISGVIGAFVGGYLPRDFQPACFADCNLNHWRDHCRAPGADARLKPGNCRSSFNIRGETQPWLIYNPICPTWVSP
jgi:uncharacterized membrane protein YeaQ/YmgE (transglycosylase-associated protein family)